MRALLKGDLKALYNQRAIAKHRNGAIEYVTAYKYRTESHPEDTYAICCVGKNQNGVPYTGKVMDCLGGQYFFQCDTEDLYERVKNNPELLYELKEA